MLASQAALLGGLRVVRDFALSCKNKREYDMALRRRAGQYWVAKAVRTGLLPPAKYLLCFDCGKGAQCYDHRDYRKPHKVEPVCFSCNAKRGPGAPYDGYLPFRKTNGR